MPQTTYLSSFTSGATVAGFDVLTNGYMEQASPNATIKAIPWAPGGYAIVVQSPTIGQLRPRRYRVVVYTETDYGALRSLVSQTGTLVTPREAAASAILDEVQRADFQDPNLTTGSQTLELRFRMIV